MPEAGHFSTHIEPFDGWRLFNLTNTGGCDCDSDLGCYSKGLPEDFDLEAARSKIEAQPISYLQKRLGFLRVQCEATNELESATYRNCRAESEGYVEQVRRMLHRGGFAEYGILMEWRGGVHFEGLEYMDRVVVPESELNVEVFITMKEDTLYVFTKEGA